MTKTCSPRGAHESFTNHKVLAIAQRLLQRSLIMLMLTYDKAMLLQKEAMKLLSNCTGAPAQESRYVCAYTMKASTVDVSEDLTSEIVFLYPIANEKFLPRPFPEASKSRKKLRLSETVREL